MKKNLFYAMWIAILFSCDVKMPVIPNEEEVITTLVYTLIGTDTINPDTVLFSFKDLMNDNAAVIINDTLQANSTYQGVLTLLNELENPPGDITAEIQEEDLDHQFFYTTSLQGLSISYSDMDGNGNPLGLTTDVTTTTTGTGNISIVLRHLPNKSAQGVANGDIANAGGETDIQITFEAVVQ